VKRTIEDSLDHLKPNKCRKQLLWPVDESKCDLFLNINSSVQYGISNLDSNRSQINIYVFHSTRFYHSSR